MYGKKEKLIISNGTNQLLELSMEMMMTVTMMKQMMMIRHIFRKMTRLMIKTIQAGIRMAWTNQTMRIMMKLWFACCWLE